MCVGIPLRVESLGQDGLANCVDANDMHYALPVQTALLDRLPEPGDWVLTHIDTAIRPIEADEARLIADALNAVDLAARGEAFEHLLGDLLDREPQLPPHLRSASDSG